MHDVENLVANLLTLATLTTLADGAKHEPGDVPRVGRVAEELAIVLVSLDCQAQLAGLHVVVALPRELAVGGVPEPDIILAAAATALAMDFSDAPGAHSARAWWTRG